MGWSIVPEPGTKYGPCKDDCEHLDCADWRRVIGSPCSICGEPIEPGQAIQYDTDPEQPAHTGCVWEKYDTNTN